jgi:galactokinase
MTIKAKSPGRVNLIGEHTDYSGGLAFGIGVNLFTEVTYREFDRELLIIAKSLNSSGSLHDTNKTWTNFVRKAASLTGKNLKGILEISGNLPVSSGLSSSAALSVSLLLAFGYNEDDKTLLAKTARDLEILARKTPCGILDQMLICHAQKERGCFLNCETLEVTHYEIPEELGILLVDSGIKRDLNNTAYELRQSEIKLAEREIGPLRDAHISDLKEITDPLIKKRARHVISENNRVKTFVNELVDRDFKSLGQILLESHYSLSGDYEVSTDKIDNLVKYLNSQPPILGARIMGAGFGGFVVALYNKEQKLTLEIPNCIDVVPSKGPEVIALN